MNYCQVLLVWILCLYFIEEILASEGDWSYVYNKCFWLCEINSCAWSSLKKFIKHQSFIDRLLGWTCVDNCRYECMWQTVEAYEKDGSGVPKFHGKWPFIKIFGMQEPASVIFSFLNIIPHVVMLYHFRKMIPRTTPMYWIIHCNAAICIHAWTWSIIFHARDTDFTEKMDYFTAFSLVTFQLFTFCARILGTENYFKVSASFLIIAGIYVYHIYYLNFVHFDYGYNMEVNIVIGILNSIGWITWAYKVRKQQPYVKKVVVMLILFNLSVMLEVFDFPPFMWAIDAHSLWHLATSPLCILWYKFLIDDCMFLEKKRLEKRKAKEAFDLEQIVDSPQKKGN